MKELIKHALNDYFSNFFHRWRLNSQQTWPHNIFLLGPEYRLQFLQHAARLLGCAYICIWSPFPHQSSHHLSCIGAWLREEHDRGLSRILFDGYRGSFCSIVSGCVPGWAFKDVLPYLALGQSELLSSASHQVQEQFYQESGVKTAVFVGCQNGEIELGMATISPDNLAVNVQRVFSDDFIQQSLLSELLQTVPPTDQPIAFDIGRPSSSSSSLPLSVGSPEDSLFNMPQRSQSLTSEVIATSEPLIVPAAHQLLMQAYGVNRNLQFPAPESDEETMARAILAVISSSTPSSSSFSDQVGGESSGSTGAFKAYKSSLRSRVEPIKEGGLRPQRMVNTLLAMLRRMYWTQHHQRMEPEEVAVRPTGSQLHHMISERKRREKLNDSFNALRKMLPPGSKKDKASVLSKTTDYVSTLKAQINELDEKNKKLEMQISQAKQPQEKKTEEVSESSESIQVQITRVPSESESESESTPNSDQRIYLRIIVREEEYDLTDLLLRLLGCLKENGDFKLVSIDASSDTPRLARAGLTLQVTADNYDEASLKEAVKKVVEDAVPHQPEMQ